MNIRWAVLAAAMAGSLASAQNASTTIWNDLKLGMTKAEVSALYPKKATSIIPGCQARVNGDYVQGRLGTVNLVSFRSDPAARCAEVIQATLIRKYGSPQVAEGYENRKCNPLSQLIPSKFGELCRQNSGEPVISIRSLAWVNEGIHVVLKREEVCPCVGSFSADVWSIVYQPSIRSDSEAASKL